MIDAGFAGRRTLAAALAAYERQRDEEALPLYEEACARAAFAPFPAEVYTARAARRAAQDAARDASHL